MLNSKMKYYARHELLKNILRPARSLSEARCTTKLWLDKNENMDPLYHGLIQNYLKDLPASTLYSYPNCHEFYDKLAQYLSVEINQLFIAGGSDGIIRAIFDAFINQNDTVLYLNPTFAMYELYIQMYGAKGIALDYAPSAHGPQISLDVLCEAIQKCKPKLICLANPNSPTGTVFSLDELQKNNFTRTGCECVDVSR